MSRSLDELNPYVKRLAQKLIEKCKNQNIEIIVTQTFRSFNEQANLYAQGRSKSGKIVTNAKPGYSMHNYGLAFDFCPIIDGKAAWDRVDLFEKVGVIGKSIGLEWGGDFKSIKDRPHFQATGGLIIKDLLAGKRPLFLDPKNKDIEFINSINKLVEKGIINSPDYWANNCEYKYEYVKQLIIKFAKSLG